MFPCPWFYRRYAILEMWTAVSFVPIRPTAFSLARPEGRAFASAVDFREVGAFLPVSVGSGGLVCLQARPGCTRVGLECFNVFCLAICDGV
jgi:hypothetical protein